MNIASHDLNELIGCCTQFYNLDLKRHNDASHPINILLFLIDNAITDHPELRQINENLKQNNFTVQLNIPASFGGTGQPIKTWMMCDYPLTIYVSIRLNNNIVAPEHSNAIKEIMNRAEFNGWRCTGKDNIGKFRGPGKKEDECPIATLNVLKLLSLTDETDYTHLKEIGINSLLNLWKARTSRKPYLFGMGTDFKKIKYPMIWYDILNVVDVLSRFKSAISTNEFKEMYAIVHKKIETNNFVPESVFQFWKLYDFGQKKNNSIYLEKAIRKIEQRIRLKND